MTQRNTLNGVRTVVYSREVLVKHPTNKYENTRFGVSLKEERGAGESYEAVYSRLERAGNDILAKRILAFTRGIKQFTFDNELRDVQEEYGL